VSTVVGIAALLASGEKAAHAVQKGLSLFRAAESNPSAVARFEETSAAATREMLKDGYAAVKALVAHALDREPSDPEVDAVMMDAAEHPNAPFRFHRLLGEARKSASRRRRRFLASVAFGLEFSALPDDLRDRVDLVVERLVPEDVDLLMTIDEKNRKARPAVEKDGIPFNVGGSRVAAVIQGISVRLGTTDDHEIDQGFIDAFYEGDRYLVSQAAFGALVAVGCIDVGQSQSSQGHWEIHRLLITELGSLVIRAIEEVRAGFADE
jgi:hypothetical protein